MSWWARLVPTLVSAVDAVVAAAHAFVHMVRRAALRVGIAQVALLTQIARRVAEAAVSIAEGVRSLVSSAMYPYLAWQLADRWDADVIDRLRADSGPDRATSAVRGEWTGPASDEYLTVVEEQHDAAAAVLAGAEAVRDSLRQSAEVVIAFYAALTIALVELAEGLSAGAAAAATGIGVGPGVVVGGAATAKVVGAVVGLVAALWLYQSQPIRVADQVADSIAAAWPPLRTRLFADGTLRDGDTTDWRIRR